MEKWIDLSDYPVRPVLKLLLTDKTTKQNIVFATGSYTHMGSRFMEDSHIDAELLLGIDRMVIQPRVLKEAYDQAQRTKKKAEVMTPSWIVNKMNNHCDEEWFGYRGAFNTETDDRSWVVSKDTVRFPDGKSWQEYVYSARLEITCGEAPYLVSRYDTTTGESIPVERRIGILDRKLRVVGENTGTKEEWFKWVVKAYQSTYGYEYQGDNLLLARINLLITFVDYMEKHWNEKPTTEDLRKIANIIVWNIWQMDGLTGMVPFYRKETFRQLSFFDYAVDGEEKREENAQIPARIFDWRSRESVTYNSLKER
ncbi:MAG: restriction endonuclease subunit M [Lachnospiraceae bacterium]|nr:restriction endonuclease subunit M [Lachnospiraceae bacterium]